MLAAIHWNIDPNLLELGPLTIRWYGLLFALAFLVGHYILQRIFVQEEVPEAWLDKVLIYTLVGTILGARLGHVLFYGWDYYSQNLAEIPQIWKGGLASHGGAIGIILALWIYSKAVTKRSILWILDRVVIPIALGGAFIRTGNLMNSEIVGAQTDVPWAFIFERLRENQGAQEIARHPSQIYESLCYVVIFFILHRVYWKTGKAQHPGYIFGLFLVLVFGARFFLEFFKRNQTLDPGVAINMGQWLSIPFVAIGLYFVLRKRGG